MVTEISTNDAWEAAYMLLAGATLNEIEGAQTDGRIICRMVLTGENVSKLQITYLNGEAQANILNLRRTLGQVNALIHSAKKKFKNQLKQEEPSSQGGEA